MNATRQRLIAPLRSQFDDIYDSCILGGGFFESDAYYKLEKERYWRSLELLCELDIRAPARVIEIGGGQLALLCKKLFGDDCIVADISPRVGKDTLEKAGIGFFTLNLMDSESRTIPGEFDVVLLLEVIEHIPLPGHIVIERIEPLMKEDGILFLTTPNLFRIRNLIRMMLGIEFLDYFTFPSEKEHCLGHQLEYSAKHLQWQLHRAGMEILMLREDNLGNTSHSLKARLARTLLAPLQLRPKWRDGLVVAARKASAIDL